MANRTTLALIIAPLWVPVAFATIEARKLFPYPEQLHWTVISTGLSAIFSYTGVVVFGLPALSYLKVRRMTGPWFAVGLGLVGGVATWSLFIVALSLFLGEGLQGLAYYSKGSVQAQTAGLLIPATLGILVGLTFWIIDRPDLVAPSEQVHALPKSGPPEGQ